MVVLTCTLAATVSVSAPAAEHQLRRHAAVGETVRIRGHVNYHGCGRAIPTTITVVRAPVHGALEVRDDTVRSVDPDLGTGEKCRDFTGPGKVVYYTRTSSGPDRLEYTSSSENGVVKIDVTID